MCVYTHDYTYIFNFLRVLLKITVAKLYDGTYIYYAAFDRTEVRYNRNRSVPLKFKQSYETRVLTRSHVPRNVGSSSSYIR